MIFWITGILQSYTNHQKCSTRKNSHWLFTSFFPIYNKCIKNCKYVFKVNIHTISTLEQNGAGSKMKEPLSWKQKWIRVAGILTTSVILGAARLEPPPPPSPHLHCITNLATKSNLTIIPTDGQSNRWLVVCTCQISQGNQSSKENTRSQCWFLITLLWIHGQIAQTLRGSLE